MAVSANVGGWIADTLVERGTSVTTVRKVSIDPSGLSGIQGELQYSQGLAAANDYAPNYVPVPLAI